MTPENIHIPVLLKPITEVLDDAFKGIATEITVFDGTLGGGGYTNKFLEKGYNVYSSDLDQTAIDSFWSSNPDHGVRATILKGNFSEIINDFRDSFFDAIVLDLGFSSNQLENSVRGFSYMKDEEIMDLRYDMSSGASPCYKKLERIKSPEELWKVIYTYSGESLSRNIARAIFEYVNQQKNGEVLTVGNCKNAIINSIPRQFLKHKNSILSRVWQALRIWTNNELENLQSFLEVAPQKLKASGVLCVVSFHSLEDKIVTKLMRSLSKPVELDSFGNKFQYYKLLTPKAIEPDEKEISYNPRSRSGMLRVLSKV